MLRKPAGTSNKEGVAKVADAAVVVVTFATFMATVPLEIVTFCSVKFPTVDVVPPSVMVALPSVAVLLANPELGITALICEGAILIVALDAAVRRPCASTVKDPTMLALP